MKKYIFFVLTLFVCLAYSGIYVGASTYEVNFSAAPDAVKMQEPNFLVQTLKYEPYPVNAGDWFDIWIKVQNVGEQNAPDAVFELMPEYPFSTADSTKQEYGLVSGRMDAYKNMRPEEQLPQQNQVVLKYRVKVADNADEGTHTLKFSASTNGKENNHVFNLPIFVEKTKTDFDVTMQNSNFRGTTFAVANIGEKPASAVTLAVSDYDQYLATGPTSVVIGDLNQGDFTSASFQLLPNENVREITMAISYTDIAGIRNTVKKKVPVKLSSDASTQEQASGSGSLKAYINLLNMILGITIGLILAFVMAKVSSKKKK